MESKRADILKLVSTPSGNSPRVIELYVNNSKKIDIWRACLFQLAAVFMTRLTDICVKFTEQKNHVELPMKCLKVFEPDMDFYLSDYYMRTLWVCKDHIEDAQKKHIENMRGFDAAVLQSSELIITRKWFRSDNPILDLFLKLWSKFLGMSVSDIKNIGPEKDLPGFKSFYDLLNDLYYT